MYEFKLPDPGEGLLEAEIVSWKVAVGDKVEVALLLSNAAMMLLAYLLLRLQGWLPLNGLGNAAQSPDLAFNTAASFITNTNWQAYGGETTMSQFSQMASSMAAI